MTSSRAVRALGAAERLVGSRVTAAIAGALGRGARTLGAAAGLALCANSTATLPPGLRQPAPAAVKVLDDPRIAHLEQFFRYYRCSAPHHVAEYLRAADGYGLDYRLLPALSVRETTCGLQETQNNRWGYHPGRQSFSSIEAGIDYVARQLAENPVYKGKALADKLFTYNPRREYPQEVERFMRQIE